MDTFAQVQQLDPAQGGWCKDIKELNVWLDVSLLVVGVALDAKGAIIEDEC